LNQKKVEILNFDRVGKVFVSLLLEEKEKGALVQGVI